MQAYTARLVPYDPKRDRMLRIFVLGTLRFDAGVWMNVDAPTAALLRAVHQSYYDAFSPPAFEVRTREEHDRLEAQGPATAESSSSLPSAPEEAPTPRKPEKKGRP